MPKRSIPFSTFQSINRLDEKRTLVLFGAGLIAEKTIRKLKREPAYFVDNSVNTWGTQEQNRPVQSPQTLMNEALKPFIIICTTSYVDVAAQLEEMDFLGEHDFIVSPILNDLRIIDEIEQVEPHLLLASGAQISTDHQFGGGLYEVHYGENGSINKKVFNGSCHSILPAEEGYWVSDDEQGILLIDKHYKIKHSIPFPEGSRGHGISYHPASETLFIACSGLDCILRYDKKGCLIQTYPLSIKQKKNQPPCHHTNDCLILNDSLYVSMFSATGNWKQDIFDGAVIEYDIHSGEKIGTVIHDLWMPHNIQYIDGSLTVLDSLRGGLVRNNAQTVGQFPAFTRGLAHDGAYFYIGQSKNRNFSKNLGVSLNISIDTSIIIFDEITKVSRTIPLPSKISEVHALALL